MNDVLTRLAPALSDKYRIEREIGAGGMASVYLAHDIKHHRDVAIKVLRSELAAVLGAERFLNEIRISAALDHPHILTLIDSGEADGFLYYVMPFVRGESLRHWLDRERQLGVEDALNITRQVASALEYAHRRGVVHRDIKPENILIHEGEATLADFGIAMAVKEAGGNRLTETGLSLGTPQYMSPEQATGDRSLDARSDVYSLAAVLYEMLAGEPPHSGVSVQAIIAKLMTERPTRLRVMRDTVPEGIDNAVAKALSKVPADRYPNAGEFARALTGAPAITSPAKRTRWPVFAIGGSALALTAAAAVVFGLLDGGRERALVTPDRVQLTATGNALWPSLSPDGNRLAFAERQCGEDGSCKWQVVIQDVDGTGRLVVASGAAGIGDTQWTADGRYVVYSGSYGSSRWGAFSVSTLGGTSRFLGCCYGSVLNGDTVAVAPVVAPGDSVAMIRLVTLRDGQPTDSFPVKNPGIGTYAWRIDDPQLLLMMVQPTDIKPVEFRIVDRRGRVLSRTSDAIDARGSDWTTGWLNGRSALLVGVPREPGSNMHDFFLVRIDGTRIVQRQDTVIRGIELLPGIDVSRDASRMVYTAGSSEQAVLAFEARAGKMGRARHLLTSTTPITGRISPDGQRVALRRGVTGARGRQDQIWLTSFNGGELAQLTAPMDPIVDFEWFPDGEGIVYIKASPDGGRVVASVEIGGSRTRELGKFGVEMAGGGVLALTGGGFILVPPDGTRITLFTAQGKHEAAWNIPRWFSRATRYSGSPDGKSIALMGWDRPGDSAVVATLDISSGQFNRIATLASENYGRVKWTRDDNIVFDNIESRGVRALYTMKSDGTALTRLGDLPRLVGHYTVADDGKRIAAFVFEEKSDVYMIRNLAEILNR